MKTKVDFFTRTFLFTGMPPDKTEKILQNVIIEKSDYTKGEIIYSPDVHTERIGFVLKGSCQVARRKTEGGIIPLNTAEPLDSFGILTCLRAEDSFPTFVVAKKDCTVLFIKKEDFLSMIRENSELAMNVIDFMAKKISFLNHKISSFSGENIEQRVASYILDKFKKENSAVIPFNKKKASENMNVSRATLYRALDKLEELKLITFDSKKIFINDLKGLERISQ